MNAAAYNFMAQEMALQPKVRDEKETIQFWEQKAMTHSRHTLGENAGWNYPSTLNNELQKISADFKI